MDRLSCLLLFCAALAVVSMMPGCAAAERNPGNEAMVAATGTVVFNNLEGGFWGIVADDGKRYDPMNLDKPFQVDGLRVRFEGRLRRDVASFHMWGSVVELVSIEMLK